MKVLLINPPTSFSQIYGEWDLSPLDTYVPPLGILHLASYIREYNHEPLILDLQVERMDLQEIINFILSKNPEIVGFSAMTINCLNVNKIATELKKNMFLAPVILGGAHISAAPVETLKKFKAVDYGVFGEGEITFLELIERISNAQSCEEVKGIVWRNDDGKVVVNDPRMPVQSLDELPMPAWDILDGFPEKYPSSLIESKRQPATSIMTSRGCPFQCTFCDNRVFGSKVRHFSTEYTLEMMRYLKREYGIRDLMILDDNFLINKEKLFSICEGMIAEKMGFTWYCIGHAKSMTEERLHKVKEAGCWFIELGIESGNDELLKRIKKNTSKAEIREAVENAKKAGLKIKGNFIFGFPGDTRVTIEETIQFALDLRLDFLQQNFLTVWPGCAISEELSNNPNSKANFESNWEKLAHQRITFIPEGLLRKDLVKASKDVFRRFYLRPRIIIGLLPLMFSLRGLRFCFAAFYVFLRTIFGRNPADKS